MKRREGFTYTQIPFERDQREGTTLAMSQEDRTIHVTSLTNAYGARLFSRTGQ